MEAEHFEPDGRWLARFRRNLLNWYGNHARDLPWRRTWDAYRVWISEIMLQQTTVTAVVPYFERFMARFPTIATLAEAGEEDVLRMWEGLGYYSRARNIRKAARRLVEERDGRFPRDVDDLSSLPGIGRYTAGAIASFAFDARAPIVEANTLRLYSRLLNLHLDPRSRHGQAILWSFAERILPRTAPGRFNQALMELGATVCLPVAPRCADCPVRTCCGAYSNGTQHEIPVKAPRPETTAVTEAAVAVRKNGAYLLCRRGAYERWAGLWDFPRFGLAGDHETNLPPSRVNGNSPPILPGPLRRHLAEELRQKSGVSAAVEAIGLEFSHSVTRYRIRLLCLLARFETGRRKRSLTSEWVRPADFHSLPLSVSARRFANWLERHNS